MVFLSASFIACNNEPSLQEYYIEKQNSNEFIALDLPASIVSLNENSSAETKETMASIKKLNILAYKLNDSIDNKYTLEYKKVKEILKNEKYTELIRMNHNGANIIIKYLGTAEAIDEIILFGADKKRGFILARVLGDHMNPEKMIKLAQNMNELDNNNGAFSQIEGLLSEFNLKNNFNPT